jgi:hypothetical protein
MAVAATVAVAAFTEEAVAVVFTAVAVAAFTQPEGEAVVVSVALGMAVPPELEESMRALLKEAMEGGITSPAATTCSTEVGFERPL